MEFSLLGAALVGVLALYLVLRWEAARGNAADCTKDLWDTALAAGVAGLIVGRLAAMIIAGTNPVTNPGDILIVRSGVDTGWATLGALATVVALARRESVAVLAGLSAAALAGLGGWEAGCVVRDTCHGTVTDLPWGIALDGSEVARHPVGLYAALLFFAVAALVIWLKRRRQHYWIVIGVALGLAGAVRLAVEPLRPALGDRPAAWYAAAVVAGAAVAGRCAVAARKNARSGKGRP